ESNVWLCLFVPHALTYSKGSLFQVYSRFMVFWIAWSTTRRPHRLHLVHTFRLTMMLTIQSLVRCAIQKCLSGAPAFGYHPEHRRPFFCYGPDFVFSFNERVVGFSDYL